MPLTTVVFDADETLLDLRPAVTGALTAVLEEMRRLTTAAAGLSLVELDADWREVFAEMAAEPVVEIRRAALARSLARVGLGDELDRVAEPDPAFYAAVLAAAGASSTEVLHVGDSLAHDVVAAQAAGLRAVWLNRDGRSRPDGVRPDAEIRTLAELPEVILRFDRPKPL